MASLPPVAAVTIITGPAGSGKTLRAVWLLNELLKANPYRPAYAVGIAGYKGAAQSLPIEGFDFRKTPVGSVIVLDEGHLVYPQTGPGKVDEQIVAMRQIRHGGRVLIITSQSAMDLHHSVRRICGYHEHIYAVMAGRSRIASGPQFRDDRVADSNQDDVAGWKLPPAMFDQYRSATMHNVTRRRLPPGLSRAFRPMIKPLLFLVVIGGFILVFLGSFTDAVVGASDDLGGSQVMVEQSAPAIVEHAPGEDDISDSGPVPVPDSYIIQHGRDADGKPFSVRVADRIVGYGVAHKHLAVKCLHLSGRWSSGVKCLEHVERAVDLYTPTASR